MKEKRNIVLRRIKFDDVPIEDLTDVELQDIIAQLETDLEDLSDKRNLMGSMQLFGYLLLNYAMRLYQVEHLEKTKQKAEEKRLENFLKTS